MLAGLPMVTDVTGSASAAGSATSDDPAPAAKSAKPITEALEGTTVTFDLLPVPKGKLTKPDPSDPTKTIEVDIGGFSMSKLEITWDVYDIFVYRLDEPDPEAEPAADALARPSKPYLPPDRGFGHAGFPAISMTANAAGEFCKWLSQKTGKKYRLPTEDEWEYVCRAGAPAPAADAAAESKDAEAHAKELEKFAWFKANSPEQTQEAGKKEPNVWGFHDMLGNAQEWVVGRDGKPTTKGGGYDDPAELLVPEKRQSYEISWQSRDPQIPKSKWWLSDGPFCGVRVVCEGKK
jgi:formylglycine-generating enzyme required for sulfatase activity